MSTPPLNRIALSEAAVAAVSYVRMSTPLFDGSNVPLYFSTVSQLPQGNGGATYNDTTSTFIFGGSFFNMAGLSYDVHLRRDFSACPAELPQLQRGGPIFGIDNNGAPLSIVSVISDAARVCSTQVFSNAFYHRYDGPLLKLANYNSLVDFIAGGGAPNPITILLPSDNALINGASSTLQAAAADCAGGKIVAWKSTHRVTGQVARLGQSSTCIITAQVPAGSQYITAYRAGTRWSKTVLVTSDRPQAQLTLSATAITLQPTQTSAPLTINWQSSDLGGYPLSLTRQVGTAQAAQIQQGNSGQFIDSIAVCSSTTFTYRLRRELSPGNYETLAMKELPVTRIVQYQDFIGVAPLLLNWDGACFNSDIPIDTRPRIHFSHNIAAGAVLTMNGQILTTTSPSQTSYAPGSYVVTINQFPSAAYSEYGNGIGFNHSNANICIVNAATGNVQQCTAFWLTSREAPDSCTRHNIAPIVGSIDLSDNSPVIFSPTTLQTISWVSQNAAQITVTEQVNDDQEILLSQSFSGVISRYYYYTRLTYRIRGVFAGENWLLGEKTIQVLPEIASQPDSITYGITNSPNSPVINYKINWSDGRPYPSLRYELQAQEASEDFPFWSEYQLVNTSNMMSHEFSYPANRPYGRLRRYRIRGCNVSCSGWTGPISNDPNFIIEIHGGI